MGVMTEDDEVVGVDRRHDVIPPAALRRHRKRGGQSPPSFLFLLGLPPRWEESFSSSPWPPWLPEGRSPSEIGSLSLCFSSVSRVPVFWPFTVSYIPGDP